MLLPDGLSRENHPAAALLPVALHYSERIPGLSPDQGAFNFLRP